MGVSAAVAINIPSKSFASVVRGMCELPSPRLRKSLHLLNPKPKPSRYELPTRLLRNNPSVKPMIEDNVISSAARKRDYGSSLVILKRGRQREYLPKKAVEGEFRDEKEHSSAATTDAADKEQQQTNTTTTTEESPMVAEGDDQHHTKEEEEPLKIITDSTVTDLAKVDEGGDSDDEKRRLWDHYFTTTAPLLMTTTPTVVAVIAPPPPDALPLPTFLLKH